MNFFRSLSARLSEARRRHRALVELMQLDDRTLADIGVPRSQIEAAVLGTLERERSKATLVAAPEQPLLAANRNRSHRAA